MTDNEKMLETLKMMAEEAKNNRLNQQIEAARAVREMFDSYLSVGFTRQEALDLTKTMLTATLGRIPVK